MTLFSEINSNAVLKNSCFEPCRLFWFHIISSSLDHPPPQYRETNPGQSKALGETFRRKDNTLVLYHAIGR